MEFNQTPNASRVYIGFFGCRNAGKSSLVNAITGQDIAVVSNTKGTTTDPVSKAMELLPLGPVLIIDTPGYDDVGELGELRIKAAKRMLNKTDIAVLVVDATVGILKVDKELISLFEEKNIPYIIALNKSDLKKCDIKENNEIYVSAKTGENIEEIKNMIASFNIDEERFIIKDLIDEKDVVVLVTPIDESAPKGRLILPQQMTIREILDKGAISVVTKETELPDTLNSLKNPPKMVVVDSQVFGVVNKMISKDITLTSFSILMARYKGFLETAIEGVKAIDRLEDGDTVLIAEGCTHHRQCNDIGTVKIPNGLKKYTGKNLNIKTCSGVDFPEDLSEFKLIIHCGGCMINQRELLYRMKCAKDQNVEFTNYGTLLAHFNGILTRSIEFLK